MSSSSVTRRNSGCSCNTRRGIRSASFSTHLSLSLSFFLLGESSRHSLPPPHKKSSLVAGGASEAADRNVSLLVSRLARFTTTVRGDDDDDKGDEFYEEEATTTTTWCSTDSESDWSDAEQKESDIQSSRCDRPTLNAASGGHGRPWARTARRNKFLPNEMRELRGRTSGKGRRFHQRIMRARRSSCSVS